MYTVLTQYMLKHGLYHTGSAVAHCTLPGVHAVLVLYMADMLHAGCKLCRPNRITAMNFTGGGQARYSSNKLEASLFFLTAR